MADTNRPGKKRSGQPANQPTTSDTGKTTDHPLEEHPAVDRGERIDTGKTISRGGKQTGHVSGATGPPREKRAEGSHSRRAGGRKTAAEGTRTGSREKGAPMRVREAMTQGPE